MQGTPAGRKDHNHQGSYGDTKTVSGTDRPKNLKADALNLFCFKSKAKQMCSCSVLYFMLQLVSLSPKDPCL